MRYERKFHVDQLSARQAEILIKTPPAHFYEVYPPRIVNNIYFDTEAMSDYRKHVNGAADRSKLRLRWYGSPDGPGGKAALEVKSKQGQVGSKTVCPIDGVGKSETSDHRRLSGILQDRCDDRATLERLSGSSPSLFNTYSRQYFASVDNQFRLTLDTHVTVQSVQGRPFGPRSRFVDEHLLIMELKYDTVTENEVSRILEKWPFRLGRISKYVYGVQRLLGIDLPLV